MTTPSSTACRPSSRRCKTGQIECRVYNKDKFHAKAYITHGKFEVDRFAGAGRIVQLHAPGLTDERRAEHPDPERTRGRPASGVVREALEGRRGRHRRRHRM